MIRIGVVNIDVSHPKAFSEYLTKGSRARYTAVYNDGFRSDDEVKAFINNFGLEKRCNSIEELADIVDIGFIQSCNWDNHLKQALPFIKRGKPVFIDKPIVGSLKDCIDLEELAQKGAVVLGSSSLRYAGEISNFLSIPEKERGKIVSVFGSVGIDEFNYGIHVVEPIEEIAGAEALSVRFVGRAEVEGSICDTYFIKFKNGISAVYNTFTGVWQPHELLVITTKGTYNLDIDTTKVYGALLDKICDYMETGENKLAPPERLTASIKIMLAGRLSKEGGGAEIKPEDIPADDPGFNGKEFNIKYASTASKIYL